MYDLVAYTLKRGLVSSMVERIIDKGEVDGSSPLLALLFKFVNLGDYPSGQRKLTVNQLRVSSVVRLYYHPPLGEFT